jgi:hopanoid-associated phosphorylase
MAGLDPGIQEATVPAAPDRRVEPGHEGRQAHRMTDPATLLVVTGLGAEARIIAGVGVTALCSGADAAALRQRLATEPARYRAVVSFGLAGALDPALRPGAVVVGRAVTDAAGATVGTDARLTQLLAGGLAAGGVPPVSAIVAGSDVALIEPAAKAALRATGGASIVDMESHIAAEFAGRHGLPFVVLRAVSDPAGRRLPALVTRALRPDGGVDLPAVIAGLARDPRQLGGLIAAGRDARAGFAALRRCRLLLGPLLGLGGADLGELLADVP